MATFAHVLGADLVRNICQEQYFHLFVPGTFVEEENISSVFKPQTGRNRSHIGLQKKENMSGRMCFCMPRLKIETSPKYFSFFPFPSLPRPSFLLSPSHYAPTLLLPILIHSFLPPSLSPIKKGEVLRNEFALSPICIGTALLLLLLLLLCCLAPRYLPLFHSRQTFNKVYSR